MRYVLEFFTIILAHPTKFCQYFILLIENFNLYSDEDGVKHIRIKARHHFYIKYSFHYFIGFGYQNRKDIVFIFLIKKTNEVNGFG